MSLRRLLIVTHRWLGIPMSVVFIVWFASGIVMMYAGGMPQLVEERRIERLAPIDMGAVRLSPAEAAERAYFDPADAGRTVMLTVLGRPAYRFGRGPDSATVFADDGALLDVLEPEESRKVAARFLDVPDERVRYAGTIDEPDQWTLVLARDLPLHKLAVDDEAGTEVYVSPYRAEVTLVTTRGSRALSWLGAIPHWFYFTPLRVNQPLWYWTVVWASALGCLLAVLGLALGVTQFRRSKPFRLSASIRYRGWMRWHYVLGVLFGVFTLTWVFSGMLSMEPFAWTRAEGPRLRPDALAGGALDLTQFPPADPRAWAEILDGRSPKEIELARIQGEPYYVVRYTAGATSMSGAPDEAARRERLHEPYRVGGRYEASRLLVAARTMTTRAEPFGTDSILAKLADALPPGIGMTNHTVLDDYDAYYYSRSGEAPLPVLRVRLDDPLETWVYVDPHLSRVVAQIHRLNRVERWLFNGLHSLDFAFWYDKRPLWDIGLILLSIAGLVTSAIGLALGAKRIARMTGLRRPYGAAQASRRAEAAVD